MALPDVPPTDALQFVRWHAWWGESCPRTSIGSPRRLTLDEVRVLRHINRCEQISAVKAGVGRARELLNVVARLEARGMIGTIGSGDSWFLLDESTRALAAWSLRRRTLEAFIRDEED